MLKLITIDYNNWTYLRGLVDKMLSVKVIMFNCKFNKSGSFSVQLLKKLHK